ncbi:hypothetical protein Taro_056602 [Colocasia esculenta]|uniref:Uncharacterized protein n=1 Tax=Colocasia esculenta TaxID=4460 RepID=A0A843XXX2_COLES|nr:hypothetical protein [Colocasia esculenta]
MLFYFCAANSAAFFSFTLSEKYFPRNISRNPAHSSSATFGRWAEVAFHHARASLITGSIPCSCSLISSLNYILQGLLSTLVHVVSTQCIKNKAKRSSSVDTRSSSVDTRDRFQKTIWKIWDSVSTLDEVVSTLDQLPRTFWVKLGQCVDTR